MNLEEVLGRVETGLATAADAEALRQILALQSVQLAALRQELAEAHGLLRTQGAPDAPNGGEE